ncbi:MAG: hypothetical protein K0S71_1676 [Clostridia bacterium]|jgi:regulatory protein|nr:hypothetical protein [Clostridia bacterium]
MQTITKISLQQTPGRYNLFLDDTFFCGITEDTLIKLGLKKGMQVDEKELEVILKEESKNKCFSYCMRLLARQNYFEKALLEKLKQKEYSDEDITFALNKLKQYNYIDDTKLAEGFVKDKKKFAKKGPKYIAQALRMKGIDYETISKSLQDHYSEEEEFENCMSAARKKIETYRKKSDDDYVVRGKLYGYLSGRGFSMQVITKVLEKLLEDKNE